MRYTCRRRLRLIFFLACILITKTTDAAFEQLDLSARSAGLGGAYVALVTDANAVAWNPAGLTDLATPELSLGYLELYGVVNYNAIFGAIPLKDDQELTEETDLAPEAIGFRLTSSSDPDGVYQELVFGCAAGKQISPSTTAGLGISYLSSQANLGLVQVGTGRGLSVDVGFRHQMFNGQMSLGLAIANLISYVGYQRDEIKEIDKTRYSEVLRPHFRVGGVTQLGLLLPMLKYRSILEQTRVAIELANRQLCLGLESEIHSGYLRLGYRLTNGLSRGITAGLGYQFRQFQLDYGLVTGRYGSTTNLFSVTLYFWP